MARIPDSFVDSLLARTDIVEVIGARVPLKRKGREFSACCPFHDERTPSFTVSPSKQFYHCFGCGAHGTAIGFVMDYDRLSFPDAIEELAQRAGMEIPREIQRAAKADDDSASLYAALKAGNRFFQQQLQANAKAQAYLNAREVTGQVCSDFALGYAPDSYNALKQRLGTDERRRQLLERVGLFSKNERGDSYDKFRDRLMFPIFDRRGRVIAFGGRVLNDQGTPKYLNSPETALFHKGRELYGLWQARQANQQLQRLIVVEGYMDVIALFQAGITQAVATLGTATTPEQTELLFRSAPDVYFCFDGDKAGRRAAWRALESTLPRMKDGRQALFLFLPEGEDPDSIVRKEGAEAFEQRLQQATALSQFFFDELKREINLSTLDGKARLAERARPLLTHIPDGAFADLMQQELAQLTGVSITTGKPIAPKTLKPAQTSAPKNNLVDAIMIRLLQQPALLPQLTISPYLNHLRHLPGMPLLLELLKLIRDQPDISTGALLERFNGREEQALLYQYAKVELPGDDTLIRIQELKDTLSQLESKYLLQRITELQSRFRTLDEIEKYELRQLLAAQRAVGKQ